MGRKRYVALAVAASGLILSSAVLADTKAGIDAWQVGDYMLAVREWQAPADAGDAEALFNLGQAHRLGKGTSQDLVKAEELFAKAAAKGHAPAADNYGLLLFHRGEKKKALPYLRAAADRGDARAQYLLGLAHFNADGVERDWPRAYALVNLARQQGLEAATTALQQMDRHMPADQREQGLALSRTMQGKGDAARPPQMAANSLPPRTVAPPPPTARTAPAPRADSMTTPKTSSPKLAAGTSARPIAPPKAAATKPAAAKPVATGPWRVQLGAFSQPANATAMWNRVKNRPELAGHPRIDSSAGAATRLQAGGFPSRAAAMEACARLKAGGFDCLPVSG